MTVRTALVCLGAAVCVLSGCASTKMSSFTDPSYEGRSFTTVLAVANVEDLEVRQRMESEMAKALERQGAHAIRGMDLFPPTRDLTTEEMVSLLLDSKIEAYLSLVPETSGVREVYIPPTGSSTTTTGRVSTTGTTTRYREKSTTTTHGGYSVAKPWAEFSARLHDVATGQTIWMSTSRSKGNAFADFGDLTNSFCHKVAETLRKDGHIGARLP